MRINLGSSGDQDLAPSLPQKLFWKKLRGGVMLVLGFLLSPLSWWNDLIFNLPVAYGFGYLCNLIFPDSLLPSMIAGYWLSNVVGILLMQAGVLDLAQGETTERNFKKELLMGIGSSTIYTGLILGLVHFKVLETPIQLLKEHLPQISAFLPQ
jgi:hypothetical protein